MDQMTIFDLVPDPNIKYDPMHIKYQDKQTNRRGVETLYVTDKTWYGTLKKWRADNEDKYYFLGVDWD